MPADCKYQFSKNLFWDIDLNTLDMEKNSPYVIQRTLEYGLDNDWDLLRSYYGMDRILSEAKKFRTLDPKALAYLSVITHTPKTEFRCYNNNIKKKTMTPEELNSYRFTSYDDPTDEMLEAIMHEAGEDVRRSNALMKEKFETELLKTLYASLAKR